MPSHDIIDNRNQKLVDKINCILESSGAAHFAVGYFFISGFTAISDRLVDAAPKDLIVDNEISKQLADFQKVAVKHAIQNIRDFNGTFVADVVGLGKSFIGAAIVKHFEQIEKVKTSISTVASRI